MDASLMSHSKHISNHSMTSSDSETTRDILAKGVQSKDTVLLNNLLDYYKKNSDSLHQMISILTEESNVSLRVLDWFVTNYSKTNQDKLMEAKELKVTHIYNEYKSQLKAYNKKLFDPFSRVTSSCPLKKFPFYYDDNEHIMTTVGQLNFFKWAYETGVIAYVDKHLKEIKAEIKMRDKIKRTKTESNDNTTSTSSNKQKAQSPVPKNLPSNFTISFM